MSRIPPKTGGHARNHWRAAEKTRDGEGEWVRVFDCPTLNAARTMARNIRYGTFAAWQPEGEFDAKFQLGELDYEVHARKI
jgi:hypothetical protein